MLDRRFIVENAERVKQNCVNRGVKVDVDRFLQLEETRRLLQIDLEDLNRQANQVSKSIGKAKDPAEREARKEEGRQLREKVQAVEAELAAMAVELDALQRQIPNLSHPDAPVGVDDKSNLELFRGKTPLPEVRFPAAGPRPACREARPGGFRGGGGGGRARLLLPQERGRAAGTGLAALRRRGADARGLHARLHARPGAERRPERHRLHSPRPGNANLQHRCRAT